MITSSGRRRRRVFAAVVYCPERACCYTLHTFRSYATKHCARVDAGLEGQRRTALNHHQMHSTANRTVRPAGASGPRTTDVLAPRMRRAVKYIIVTEDGRTHAHTHTWHCCSTMYTIFVYTSMYGIIITFMRRIRAVAYVRCT